MTSRHTPTSPPRTSRSWGASWTRSGPTSRSRAASATPSYIRKTIQLQRGLAAFGRIALFASRDKLAWTAGTAALATAKIIENMELGHNITHGQWDWMNDPEIHSTEWEWDTTSPTVHWKKSHNYIHHKYTNIVGLDDDIGYGIMRLTRDQRWEKWMIGNPIYNFLLGHALRVGRRAARGGDHQVAQG